jgi:hypothetical protein
MKGAKTPKGATIACPHCSSRAIVRGSESETLLSRELRFRCDNELCGHTFVAQLVIIRTLVPSAMPNAAVHLPISPPGFRRVGPQHGNDDHKAPANDPGEPNPGDAGANMSG